MSFNNKRDCVNCVKCCLAWGAVGVVTDNDIKKWIDNSADNILQYVPKEGKTYSKEFWINLDTGEKLSVCPFLINCNGKYGCKIYPKDGEIDLRPEICITYPGNKKCLKELMSVSTSTNKDGYELNIACFTRKKQHDKNKT